MKSPKCGAWISLEQSLSVHLTAAGIFSCGMIVLAFLVPWYGVDYTSYPGERSWHEEYSVEIERMGDLMTNVTVVLMLCLTASILATVLSYLRRWALGVIATVFTAGLLLAAGTIFYFGIMDTLDLDSFDGFTQLSRSATAWSAPMLGWWILMIVPVVQATTLAYCFHRNGAFRRITRLIRRHSKSGREEEI